MKDILDNPILCDKCGVQMQKKDVSRRGFIMRAVVCPKCNSKILHPVDEQKYKKFISLKNKEFSVKMRLVGNSYAVSIPREIVLFMKKQENLLDNMVKLCFDEMDKVILNFGVENER